MPTVKWLGTYKCVFLAMMFPYPLLMMISVFMFSLFLEHVQSISLVYFLYDIVFSLFTSGIGLAIYKYSTETHLGG